MTKKQLQLLYTITIIAIAGLFFFEPIRQNQEYHNFADKRTCLFVSNFWNVISNLPFILLGIIGLFEVRKNLKNNILKVSYTLFYVGILLTGIGSSYYHYTPNDATLVWDRLPMTISFMSFLSIIISEFINLHSGRKLLIPLLLIGASSILYWLFFQDLRVYILVQFLPIILIPLILTLSKHNSNYKKYFYYIILAYFIAKLFESNDYFVYKITNSLISGHSLKHITAAIAPFIFYKFIILKFTTK